MMGSWCNPGAAARCVAPAHTSKVLLATARYALLMHCSEDKNILRDFVNLRQDGEG